MSYKKLIDSSRLLQWASLAAGVAAGIALACGPPDSADLAKEMNSPSVSLPEAIMVDPPSGLGARAPELSVAAGRTLLSWLEPGTLESETVLFVAELQGQEWSEPRRVMSGSDLFVNWADRPAVLASGQDHLWAHWLRRLGDDTYAYGVERAHSADSGASWNPAGWLHDDISETEHGFVSYVNTGDGALRAFWLDGRAMTDADGGGMQLRTTSFNAVETPSETPSETPVSQLLDERVCECCATDAALTEGGALVAYRDRSSEEVRDIAVVREVADGWSEPVIVHADGWEIHACPVNGPAVSADGSRVALAWFTAAEAKARIQLSFSEDAGASFGSALLVDDIEPLGRVEVEWVANDRAIVSWLGSSSTGAVLQWRWVSPSGAMGPTQRLIPKAQHVPTGVPRMVRHGDQLLFVWVEGASPPRIRGRLLPLIA